MYELVSCNQSCSVNDRRGGNDAVSRIARKARRQIHGLHSDRTGDGENLKEVFDLFKKCLNAGGDHYFPTTEQHRQLPKRLVGDGEARFSASLQNRRFSIFGEIFRSVREPEDDVRVEEDQTSSSRSRPEISCSTFLRSYSSNSSSVQVGPTMSPRISIFPL